MSPEELDMSPEEIETLKSKLAILQAKLETMVKHAPAVAEFVALDQEYRQGLQAIEQAQPTEE